MDERVFDFKKYNSTSAYVRLKKSKSVKITSKFLNSWMDSPSSALDLWHCGHVIFESTPEPHPLQLFSDLKTFIGKGMNEVGCRKQRAHIWKN